MFIYQIVNKVNGKRYIGQSRQPTRHRLFEHVSKLRGNRHENRHLQRAWNKYGEEQFSIEIVDRAETQEELNELEIRYIEDFRTLNKKYGYNLRSGGDSPSMSDETKRRISKTKTGVPVHTLESKAKIAASSAAREHSLESRQKRSEKLKGYKWPKEVTDAWALAHRPQGYPVLISPDGERYEGVVNLSAFCKEHGLNDRAMGRVVRNEMLTHRGWHVEGARIEDQQRREDNSRRLRPQGYPKLIDPSGQVHEISVSLSEFGRKHSLPVSTLSLMINGHLEHCRGWKVATTFITEQAA